MPNGDDKNWIRVCCSIDGFRAKYGRWPLRVRISPISYIDIIDHILSPMGFALVSSHVALVGEEDAEMVSEDDDGNSHNYGSAGGGDVSDRTIDFFGQAIFR